MRKIIYCECGWAGTPQQLEVDDTVNNEHVRVCPQCGTDMLPPAVNVSEEAFDAIMKRQKQVLDDGVEALDEDE
jgi:hypothetical protein